VKQDFKPVCTPIQFCRLQQLKLGMFSLQIFRSNHTATQRFSPPYAIVNENWGCQLQKRHVPHQCSNPSLSEASVCKTLTFKLISNYCSYYEQGRFECASFESRHIGSENLEYSEWIIMDFMFCPFWCMTASVPICCIEIFSSCSSCILE